MALVCLVPLTVYSKPRLFPSTTLKIAVPTAVETTFVGSNGTALKGGPVVRNSIPEYTPCEDFGAVTTSHIGVLSVSYVNQLAKRVSPWCVRLIPQPDSDPAGDAHQRS